MGLLKLFSTALIGFAIGVGSTFIVAYVRPAVTVHAQDSPMVWVYEVMPPGQVVLKGTQFLALSCTSSKSGNPQCFIASK
ncbi:MAG: hypothetical protein ACLQKA_05535 [Bryobacteraceae bacterium]